MPALVMFLLGIVTDATLKIGDRIKAALNLLDLGYGDLIPDSVRQHLPGYTPSDVSAPSSAHTAGQAARQAAGQAAGQAAAADPGGGHGWIWLALIVAVVLAIYLRPAVIARLSGPGKDGAR